MVKSEWCGVFAASHFLPITRYGSCPPYPSSLRRPHAGQNRRRLPNPRRQGGRIPRGGCPRPLREVGRVLRGEISRSFQNGKLIESLHSFVVQKARFRSAASCRFYLLGCRREKCMLTENRRFTAMPEAPTLKGTKERTMIDSSSQCQSKAGPPASSAVCNFYQADAPKQGDNTDFNET